jgi:hypothetical protein
VEGEFHGRSRLLYGVDGRKVSQVGTDYHAEEVASGALARMGEVKRGRGKGEIDADSVEANEQQLPQLSFSAIRAGTNNCSDCCPQRGRRCKNGKSQLSGDRATK